MKFFKPRFWDKNQISAYAIFLLPLSLLIQLFNKLRSFLIKGQKCSIQVICVGNIYLGGTGKTSICIELNSILKNLNKKTAIVTGASRGIGVHIIDSLTKQNVNVIGGPIKFSVVIIGFQKMSSPRSNLFKP